MVTDLVQIGRLTASHAAENLAFQRQLEAHHYPAEPFQVLCEQIEEQIDCKSCANCCRQTRVGVSPGEIARIADYLGITPDDVVRQYTAVDPDNHNARLLAHTKAGCVFSTAISAWCMKRGPWRAASFLTCTPDTARSEAGCRRFSNVRASARSCSMCSSDIRS